jgi:putative ABC transport system permease protein
MAKVDGVALLSRDQYTPALIGGEPEVVLGVDPAYSRIYDLDVVEGTRELGDDQAVLTDDEARDRGLRVGDQLELAFPGKQSVSVEVVGIIEPTPVIGSINVPLQVIEDMGINRTDTSLSINLDEGADRTEVQAELEEVIADVPIVSVQDKEQFAESIKGQINQLLFMIYGLLALAIVIAVIGIVNTLGLSVIERTREIGLLRAVGLSRSRLRGMVTLESVTIATMGAVLGMVIGLVIGVLLREVLKEDLTVLSLPITSLLLFLAVAVLFGVLAAVVPAVRAARMKVLDAIATE